MKTIILQQAYSILKNCAGVITEDHIITYPILSDLTGEDNNQWLYLSWDEDGLEYSRTFLEKENNNVKIAGSSMFLKDNEGEEIQLTILTVQNLET